MGPQLSRRSVLPAFILLVSCLAGACDGPLFKPSSMPSIALDSDAPGAVGIGDIVTFSLTFAEPGHLANVDIQNVHLDFGDGQSAEVGTVSQDRGIRHAYNSAGTFTATATATDTLGHEAKARITVVVTPVVFLPPSVGLFSDAANPSPVGAVITFTVSASIPLDLKNDAIANIHLDFGDGQTSELGATPPNGGVPHSYATSGIYTVTATVTTLSGRLARASLTIVVSGAGKQFSPSVGLTSNASNPTAVGTVVTFTVFATIPGAPAGLLIQSIHLDFGDGLSSDLGAVAPTTGVPHTYSAVGTYTAVATATDTNGKTGSAAVTIIVK